MRTDGSCFIKNTTCTEIGLHHQFSVSERFQDNIHPNAEEVPGPGCPCSFPLHSTCYYGNQYHHLLPPRNLQPLQQRDYSCFLHLFLMMTSSNIPMTIVGFSFCFWVAQPCYYRKLLLLLPSPCRQLPGSPSIFPLSRPLNSGDDEPGGKLRKSNSRHMGFFFFL